MKKTYFLLVFLTFAGLASAEEIHSKSNTGGGLWSDPNTWTGNKVPTSADNAVISARDVVIFDGNDADKPSCASLSIDPSGSLVFQTNQTGTKHPIILNVAGPIESYGAIKIDASGDPTDQMELHLTGPDAPGRTMAIKRGGSLAISGHKELPDNRRNAIITYPAPPPSGELAVITAGQNTMVDIQYAQLEYLRLDCNTIDNTGSKPNERLNIIQNMFTRSACIQLALCDTPAILRNTFTASPKNPVAVAAMLIQRCALADIRDNKLTGPARFGMTVVGECSAIGNTIEKFGTGITWNGGIGMMKRNTISDCETGIQLTSMNGSIEQTSIEKCKTGIYSTSSVAQLTNVHVGDAAVALQIEGTSSLSLLNCDIKKNQIKLSNGATAPADSAMIQSMQYVVVKLTGNVPKTGTVAVELKTTKPDKPLPEGAMDLNIRNSPSLVRTDMTPPPGPNSLVVNTWGIARDGKPTAVTDYTLNVIQPSEKPDEKPKILKTLAIHPEDSWYRSQATDGKPTLEVAVP
ncbi:MAG: G8 domain-containing protein [Chthoniobacterales bacterium]